MSRTKGTPNKPKETLDPGLAKLTEITLDLNLDAETRQQAAKALQEAMNPAPTAPAPSPEPTDPFAECDEWPPAGHRNCIYDSHGMYRDGGVHDVKCLIDPLRRHSFPFQDARSPQDSPEAVAAFEEELAEIEKGLEDLL